MESSPKGDDDSKERHEASVRDVVFLVYLREVSCRGDLDYGVLLESVKSYPLSST
jgi:hypothetical protein